MGSEPRPKRHCQNCWEQVAPELLYPNDLYYIHGEDMVRRLFKFPIAHRDIHAYGLGPSIAHVINYIGAEEVVPHKVTLAVEGSYLWVRASAPTAPVYNEGSGFIPERELDWPCTNTPRHWVDILKKRKSYAEKYSELI